MPHSTLFIYRMDIIQKIIQEVVGSLQETTEFYDGDFYSSHKDRGALLFKDSSGEEFMITSKIDTDWCHIDVHSIREEKRDGINPWPKLRVGFLVLNKEDDEVWRAPTIRYESLWVKEEHRRRGIASAMHDYANNVLKIETDTSSLTSPEAQGFWKNRKTNS